MAEVRKGLIVTSSNKIIRTFVDDISSNVNLNLGSGGTTYPVTISHNTTSDGEKKAVTIKNGSVGIDITTPKAKLHIDKEYYGKESTLRSGTTQSTNNPASIINNHTCFATSYQHNYYKIAQLTSQNNECYGALNIRGAIMDKSFGETSSGNNHGFSENFSQFDITIMVSHPDTTDGNQPQIYMIGTVNGSVMDINDTTGGGCISNDIIVSTNSHSNVYPKAVVLCLKSNNICNIQITSTGYNYNGNDCFTIDYDGIRYGSGTPIVSAYAEWQFDNIVRLSDPKKNNIIYNTPHGLGIGTNKPYPTFELDISGDINTTNLPWTKMFSFYSNNNQQIDLNFDTEGAYNNYYIDITYIATASNTSGNTVMNNTYVIMEYNTDVSATLINSVSRGYSSGYSNMAVSWISEGAVNTGKIQILLRPISGYTMSVDGKVYVKLYTEHLDRYPISTTITDKGSNYFIIENLLDNSTALKQSLSGKIGIGTTNPQDNLDVDRTIHLSTSSRYNAIQNSTYSFILNGSNASLNDIRNNVSLTVSSGMSVTNSGLIFSASNFHHAEIPSSIMDLGTNNFTISLWFSLNSSANNKVLFSIKDFFYLLIKNNNELWYQYPYTGGVTLSSSAAATLDYNTIYNVVITRYNSGSTSYVSLYFDGTQPHSAYDTNNVSISTYDGEISPANYLNITLYRLDIWKNTGFTNVDHIYNAGYTDSLIYGSIEGAIHDESKFGKLSFKTSTDGTLTNLNDRMTILDNGNVGIGLDLPTKKLHVSNDALISTLTVGRGKYERPENTALGVNTLNNIAYSNSSARYNTAIGYEALKSATGAENYYYFYGYNYPSSNNTAVGYKSLTNANDVYTGCINNTAVGSLSLLSSTTGSNNTAVGYESLTSSYTASLCTALGYKALNKCTSNGNIGIGSFAGSTPYKEVTSGYYNLFLGYSTAFISSTQHNYSTAIGYMCRLSKSYQIVLGGSANPGNSSYPYPDVYIPGKLGIATEYPQSKLDIEGSIRIGSTYSGNSSITTDPTDGMIVEGSVGIGTNDPKSKLDVEGSVAIGSTYSGTSAAPTDGMIVEGKVGIGTNDPKSKLDVEGSVAIGSSYSGTSAAPTDGMIVEGSVGIGTNDPKSKLDVEGNVAIGSSYSGTSAAPTNGMIVEGSVGIGINDPKSKLDVEGSVAIGSSYSGTSAAPTDGMIVEGKVGIGTNVPQSKLDIEGSIRIGSTYSGNSSITTDPTNGMIVEGNIGIGTSDPKSKLDVQGSVAIGSTYSGTSAAPTDGMIVEGKVGIGTNDPKSKLDVEGSVAIGSNYSGTSAAPTDGMIVEGSVGIGTNDPKSKLDIEGSVAIGSSYSGTSAAPTDGMIVEGKVGIGTNVPQSKLDIEGSIRIGSTYSGNSSITTDPTNGMIVEGSVGIGTSDPKSKLDVEGSVAIGSSYSGTSAAPSNGMIVEGSVGIGTNDPKSKLDVEGSVAIGSSYSGTSAAPTDGMIVEGSVGIGTNAPKAALQVFNNNGATISSAIATGIRTATLRLGTPYQLNHDAYCAKITSTNDQSNDYKSDLRFYTSVGNNASATERMCISNTGNVGIGTNNPESPLQVIASSNGTPNNNGIDIRNLSNSANNHAALSLRTAGSNGGNPYITFDIINEAGWCAGADNADNSFKITNVWDGLATGTTTSNLTDTTKFMIDNSTGNVGIGTGSSTPSEKLHVLGNTRLQGIVYIGANNPGGGDNDAAYLRYHVHSGETTELQLVCTNDAADDIGLYPGNTIGGLSGGIGEVNCYGKVNAPSFNATSDIRHKENIVELKNSLEKITSLRAVNYNLKETPNVKAAGLIAQEVDEIIPEAISKKKEDKWTLDYNTITGYLVDCIKELKKENDELKEDIKRKGDVIVKLHSDVSSIKDILKIRY